MLARLGRNFQMLEEIRQDLEPVSIASPEPVEKSRIVKAIARAYAAADLPPPAHVLIFRDPIRAAIAASVLRRGRTPLEGAVGLRSFSEYRRWMLRSHGQYERGMRGDSFLAEGKDELLQSARTHQAIDRFFRHMWNQRWLPPMSSPLDHLTMEQREEVLALRTGCYPVLESRDPEPMLQSWGLAHDHAAELSLYRDVLERIPPSADVGPLHRVLRLCSWWWAFDDVSVVSEKPTHCATDGRGRLHSTEDAALRYRDGSAYYLLAGILVPSWIVTEPSRIDRQSILAEQNLEVRQQMIRRLGYERFITTEDQILHTDGHSVLYRLPDEAGEPLLVVRVRCPSTGETYFLRVPPTVRTCQEAVAWTFDIPPEQYHPSRET